jgi:CysZ protein
MIVSALLRALPQIFRPAAMSVLGKSLALTLLLFVVLGVGVWFGLDAFFAWMGWTSGGLAEAAGAALIVIAAGWFLFRVIAIAVLGLFSDAIVVAVERDSYPDAAASARPVSMAGGLRFALRSLGRNVGWNLIALPFYILLLVTGVGTLALILIVNAYLLGRDLSEMVEPRHPDLPPIPRSRRWAMGFVSALLFLVPVANLLAPILSAAMAVHVLHGRRERTI